MVFRYPSFSQWPHAGQIWGCLLGVWMLSEGVRMVSECVRQMSEVCRCHINWKKFDYCHTNYMRPLLPVPIFVQKRPHGRYFQGGVVGFISGSTANFFVLGGQVMDIGKQWGWCWRIFLTWPRYPPTLLVLTEIVIEIFSISWGTKMWRNTHLMVLLSVSESSSRSFSRGLLIDIVSLYKEWYNLKKIVI